MPDDARKSPPGLSDPRSSVPSAFVRVPASLPGGVPCQTSLASRPQDCPIRVHPSHPRLSAFQPPYPGASHARRPSQVAPKTVRSAFIRPIRVCPRSSLRSRANGSHQARLARLPTNRANTPPQSVIQVFAGALLRSRKAQGSVAKKRRRLVLIKLQRHGHINVLLSIIRCVPELPHPDTMTLNLTIRKSPAGQLLQGLRDHSIVLVRNFCLLALQLRLLLLFLGFSLFTAFASE